MKKIPLVWIFMSVLFVRGGTLFSQTLLMESVTIPSARTAAVGGVHAALADDLTTLFANPAGFRGAGPELGIAEATLNLAGPVFSIADLVIKATGGADPITLIADPDVKKLLTGLYASGTLAGPLSFAYVGGGLGFGLFNTTGVTFTTVGSLPTVGARLSESVVFAGGYAFGIPLPPSLSSTLDLGVMLKAFAVGSVGISKNILEVLGLLVSPSPSILFDQPFDLDVGIGIDAGILYQWNGLISLGIVGRNLYSPTMRNAYTTLQSFLDGTPPSSSPYGAVPIDLSAGILFTPGLGPLDSYVTDVKVMLDYRDILDFITHPGTATNPILHAGLGVELVLLQILSLRGGFANGYFSAGLGLNLALFRLSLSMYGSELSSQPGLRPVYNLLLGLEFRY